MKVTKRKSLIGLIIVLLIVTIFILFINNIRTKSIVYLDEQLVWEMGYPEEWIGKWKAAGGQLFDTYEEAAAAQAQYDAERAEIANELGITNNSSSSSASSSSSTSSSSSSSSKSSKTVKATKPTLEEGDFGTYVILSKKAVYSNYDSTKEEIGNLYAGDEVDVTGKTSNGYYRFSYITDDNETVDAYLLFKDKDNIIDKETYETGWSETDRVEATCTSEGYIEYTNSYSELTKQKTLDMISHTRGSLEYITEPTLFSTGIAGYKCTVCGEVLEQYEVAALVPMWLWVTLGVVIAGCATCVITVVIKKKKLQQKDVS